MSLGLSHLFWRHSRHDARAHSPSASGHTDPVNHNPSFVYEPLNPSKTSSFRLVELLPGEHDSTVECRLLVDSWGPGGSPYEALSYVWGHEAHNKRIQLNGQDFNITPNLHSALMALRHNITKPKMLWIDAISISQNDVTEKNDQVIYMGSIYANCTQVLIWLGDEGGMTREAIEFLNHVRSKLPALSSLSNESLREFWRMAPLDSDTVDEIVHPRFAAQWCAIGKIFQRDWWIRAWVFQEFVMAPIVSYQLGPMNFHGGLLLMALWITYHHSEKFQCIIDSVPDFESLRESIILSGYEINQTRLNYISNVSNTHFAYLLGCQRLKECADARDRVYSILSMASFPIQEALVPDYSRSVRHIYTSAVRAYVSVYEDLDILAYSMHGSSSDIYPSWCPNWNMPRSRLTLGGPVITRGFAASGNEPAVAKFSNDSNILWLKGFRADNANVTGFQGTHAEFSWENVGGKIEATWDIQSIAQALASTHYGTLQSPPGNYTSGDRDEESPGKFQKISILKALISTLAAGDVPMLDEKWFSTERKPLGPSETKIQEPVLLHNENTGESWPRDLEGFYELLCHKTWGRTIVLSSKGRLGLAPKDTKVGDEVFILWGFRTPAILRKRPDDTYTWIGDAYMHGMMCGEAIRDLERGLYIEETIGLR